MLTYSQLNFFFCHSSTKTAANKTRVRMDVRHKSPIETGSTFLAPHPDGVGVVEGETVEKPSVKKCKDFIDLRNG